MKLTENNNVYKLTDEKRICKIIPDDCANLPEDILIPKKSYTPILISAEAYKNCTTSEYVFKEYPNENYALKMVVDIPKTPKQSRGYPFVIWVHGGAWANGSTNAFKNQSQYFASKGIAGVRITYSLKKHGGHFEMGMQELDEAVQFIKSHATDWGLDIKNFGFAGGSAGTPLSSLAAMKFSDKGCKLYIGCNGIYDFINNRQGRFCGGKTLKNKYLENITDLNAISTINHIPKDKKQIPAVVLFHGTADTTISYNQSVAFHKMIIAHEGLSEIHLYPFYAHAFFNKNASDAYEDVTLKMFDFANKIFEKSR
ncbi:hypothetical protein KH5_15550 [Urechidicola sp. KH5]